MILTLMSMVITSEQQLLETCIQVVVETDVRLSAPRPSRIIVDILPSVREVPKMSVDRPPFVFCQIDVDRYIDYLPRRKTLAQLGLDIFHQGLHVGTSKRAGVVLPQQVFGIDDHFSPHRHRLFHDAEAIKQLMASIFSSERVPLGFFQVAAASFVRLEFFPFRLRRKHIVHEITHLPSRTADALRAAAVGSANPKARTKMIVLAIEEIVQFACHATLMCLLHAFRYPLSLTRPVLMWAREPCTSDISQSVH